MIQIDARGKACPEPVIMTKNALADNPDAVAVRVDNVPATQNVSRFFESKGYKAVVSGEGKDFTVTGARDGSAPAPESCGCDLVPSARLKNAVFIAHSRIGGDDPQLGEVLMKSFLGTLVQYDENERPSVIALMNEGVTLAEQGTSSAETLRDYVAQGGTVLVCGTCLKHFGLMEKVGVGIVSNMFEIVSTLLACNTLSL